MDTMLDPKKHDLAANPQGRPFDIVGTRELWQRIYIRLAVRRGRFPLDPTLGSRLYRLPRGSPEEMNTFARGAIEEALAPMAGVRLTAVDCCYYPQEDAAQVDCTFAWGAEKLQMVIAPGGPVGQAKNEK